MDGLDPNDSDLVSRAVGGDRAAFASLIARHYDFIFAVAYKWCGNREDAEDLAQDVCVRLAPRLDSWQNAGALRSWLYTMVVNASHDRRRAQGREQAKLVAAYADPTHLADGHEMGVGPDDDVEDALWAAVRALPDRQRDCVLLVHSEGLSHAKAAAVLGCSAGTVASNIHDAKVRLKHMLLTCDGEQQPAMKAETTRHEMRHEMRQGKGSVS
ncbi:MAG: RNA polymerase sigma factor [Pseudomonadota bacterium]